MNRQSRFKRFVAIRAGAVLLMAVAVAAISAPTASAAPFTLDFEGVGDFANIQNYYNGGTDSRGNAGPNYGVEFNANTLALNQFNPLANFALPPSGDTIMFFLTGTAVMNYAPGFDTGFSFFYTTVSFSGSASVYDGLNATGNLLGTIQLDALGNGPVPGDPFSNWRIGNLAFNGVARSIDFGGTVNQVGYDNITFGSIDPTGSAADPVPEPASLTLFGLGLGGLVVLRHRRRHS